jgi:mono/diheme cytochrome c family protein
MKRGTAMRSVGDAPGQPGRSALVLLVVAASAGVAGSMGFAASASSRGDTVPVDPVEAQVQRGRLLTVVYDCGACHGGVANPGAQDWLVGRSGEDDAEEIGPFRIHPRNLTPDAETGIGRYSERQIFNAVRYGLRPSETPDVEVTSGTPGVGNHPANPIYLSPAMPWMAFRHIPDQDLRDMAAYLKRGLKPVSHRVPESGWPEDGWASAFTPDQIGVHPAPPFPTERERDPTVTVATAGAASAMGTVSLEQVLRGRELVIAHACSACHGAAFEPSMVGWLVGVRDGVIGPPQEFEIGPFTTRPRNLTPDNLTGMGRFSERQIFNALRYGLRPGETPDVEITSSIPGQGNHPVNPKYLAPPMPWPNFRHRSDQELWDIAAYLKHGVLPVSNRVEDSEGPPDFWASDYSLENIGPYPLAPFPTQRETRP